jgi:uncharacterized membrane protein YkvA (DUF1232 family)
MLARLKAWARQLKTNLALLAVAARNPHVPWQAKCVAAFTLAYALSPVDLIPDFIPVLGYIDDLILLPLGIWLSLRLIPKPLLAELRETAASATLPPASKVAAAIVILLWLLAGWWLFRFFASHKLSFG